MGVKVPLKPRHFKNFGTIHSVYTVTVIFITHFHILIVSLYSVIRSTFYILHSPQKQHFLISTFHCGKPKFTILIISKCMGQ